MQVRASMAFSNVFLDFDFKIKLCSRVLLTLMDSLFRLMLSKIYNLSYAT